MMDMRSEFVRLKKNNSTKSERRIAEILKNNHIRFLAKRRIGKYEVDFLIGGLILEIDGDVHCEQSADRNAYFIENGYNPIHIGSSGYDDKFVNELMYFIRNYG